MPKGTVTQCTPWCGRRTGPGSWYDGGPGGGSVYSIDVESGEHTLLGTPARGHGGDQRHRLVAGWLAPGDLIFRRVVLREPRGGARPCVGQGDGVVPRERGWVRPPPPGPYGRRSVAGLDPRPQCWHAWSPDGTRLAYTSLSGPDQRELQVWTVSVDGSAPSLLASRVSDGSGAVWSPDGSQIAFGTETGGGNPNEGLGHLVVNADGTGEPREIDETTYLSWLGGWYFCRCYG